MAADVEMVLFPCQGAFAQWLAAHHDGSEGVWLRLAKKGALVPSVSYQEALEVALCFGWIDGQKRSLDLHHYLQRWTPRRPRSLWSKVNREKALMYIEEGKMQPSGLVEIERAKKDGRWDAAYDSSSMASVPPELQAAFDHGEEAEQGGRGRNIREKKRLIAMTNANGQQQTSRTTDKTKKYTVNIETTVQLVHELVKVHPTIFEGVIVKHEFGEIPRPFIGDDSNADFRGMLGGHDAALKSGVYLFVAQNDEVIYIGKATKNNLHARITSHLGTPTRLENGWMTFPSTSFSQCPEEPDIVKQVRDGEIRLHALSVSDENVISFIEVYLQTMFMIMKKRHPYFNKQIG